MLFDKITFFIKNILLEQTKFTAFVLHMYKKPEDQNRMDSFFKPDKIPQIFLNLLINCPSHVPQTRREIIQTMRDFIFHCLDHRKYLASQIELFIDDQVLLGSGWTSHEAFLSTTYTQFYDVILHLRDQLSMKQIVHILNHFSKNLVLHEPTLNASYHMQTIRLLMGLVDVYAKNVERELQRQNKSDYDSRILFLKIFAIITFKVRLSVLNTNTFLTFNFFRLRTLSNTRFLLLFPEKALLQDAFKLQH